MELSVEVGKLVAKRALEKGIKEVYFDRGRYKYHGRIKAVAILPTCCPGLATGCKPRSHPRNSTTLWNT